MSNDMNDIFRALGIDPSKVPKKPTVDDSIRDAAFELHKLHEVFVDAGFSDDQAFELTKIIFKRSCE